MSALAAIHQFWSYTGAFNTLVPADRVYSGSPTIKDENQAVITRPYVTIKIESESNIQRTSSGRQLFRQQLKITTWHDNYDQAVEIDAVIRDQLNRRDFRFDRGRVLDIKPGERADTQDSDTLIWQIDHMFDVISRSSSR